MCAQLRIKANRDRVRDNFAGILKDFKQRDPFTHAQSPKRGHGATNFHTGPNNNNSNRTGRGIRQGGRPSGKPSKSATAHPRSNTKSTGDYSADFAFRIQQCLRSVFAVNFAWFAEFFVSELLRVSMDGTLIMQPDDAETYSSNAVLSRLGSKKLMSLEQRLTEPSEVRHDESDRLYERLFNSRRRHRHLSPAGKPSGREQGSREDSDLWSSNSGDAHMLPHIVKHFLLSDQSSSSASIKTSPAALQIFFLFVAHADSQWFSKYVTSEILKNMASISGLQSDPVRNRSSPAQAPAGHDQSSDISAQHAMSSTSSLTLFGNQVNKSLQLQSLASQLRKLRVLGKLLGLLTFAPYWVRLLRALFMHRRTSSLRIVPVTLMTLPAQATHDPEFASSDSVALHDTMELVKAQVRGVACLHCWLSRLFLSAFPFTLGTVSSVSSERIVIPSPCWPKHADGKRCSLTPSR